ncbi:MAG TPA: CPBP family intramembrane glutamic endopeptidase [Polyangiaceae bacterium]|jgi:membrane protease YdiL (CAAX protease family)|nr:CPBP family intramembrane glutamic endopeptidase [Polyangiaceae bacterium]
MNLIASQPTLGAQSGELSLLRAIVLLSRLRVTRWRNQLRRVGKRSPAAGSSRAGLAWLLFPLLLLALFSLQSFQFFEGLASEQSVEALGSRASLLSSVICGAIFLMAIADNGWQGRTADDELDWLLTLPARAWVVQAAKLAEATILNPLGWMLLFPFLTGLGLHVGLGIAAPLVALVLCLPLFAVGAALQSVSDAAGAWLVSHPALRGARALAGAVGTLVFVFWLGAPALSRSGVLPVTEWLRGPIAPGWLPFSEPARVVLLLPGSPLRALGWLGLFAFEVSALLAAGVLLLRQLQAITLLDGRPGRRGSRAPATTGTGGSGFSWLGPVVSKDLLWLRRNAARAMGLLLNAGLANGAGLLWLARAADGSAARVGLAALGVGLWLLLLAATLLEAERPALWQLAALPRSISRLFLPKALFSGALASAGALPVAVYGALALPGFAAALPDLGYAAAGILLCSCLQTALWLQGVNPNTPASPVQHMGRMLVVIFLAGLFAAGFGARRAPPLVLVGAFTFALWRAGVDAVPFALDPTAPRKPAPSAIVALVGVLVLRVLQLQLQPLVSQADLAAALALPVSFVAAGGVVVLGSLLWLRARGVPGLRERLALSWGTGLGATLRAGALWSIPAIALSAGFWWLFHPESAPETQLNALAQSSTGAFVALTVFAAPPVEELLFRGLLYRSLRSSTGVLPSLLLSSLVFAVVHPQAAAVPVFGLGVCAALALERSRSLLAAVLVHALYNGCIAWVALG